MSSTAELAWARYCAEADPALRADDVAALGAAWEAEPRVLDLLVRALGDAGECRHEPSLDEVRQHVVRVGEKARVQLLRHPARALPAVAMLLEAPDASEARLPPSPHYARTQALKQAIELVDRCRPRAGPFVPSVVATMTAEDAELRVAAARCLGRVAASQPEAREVIRACFDSDDPKLKAGALRASFELPPIAAWAPCFAALLTHPVAEVRDGAAQQLKKLGPAAAPQVGAIAAALSKAEAGVTASLLEALEATGAVDDACFAAIGKVFDFGNQASVGAAFAYLGHLGVRAAPMVPRLAELARNAPTAQHALAAKILIAQITPDA